MLWTPATPAPKCREGWGCRSLRLWKSHGDTVHLMPPAHLFQVTLEGFAVIKSELVDRISIRGFK